MINDLIDTASRRVCNACEKGRRLEGMVSKAEGAARSVPKLVRLADTFSRREADAVDDAAAAEAALAKAGSLLAKGALGVNGARAARAVSSIAANVGRLTGLAEKVADGAASLAGDDLEGAMAKIGGKLGDAVGAVSGTFDRLQTALTKALTPTIPSLLPANIELTALGPGDLGTGFVAGLKNAGSSTPHLLVLSTSRGQSFYFNLSTAGYDTLRRQSSYNVAAQDRLTRRPALQAVSKGGESITVSGAIFTRKSGAGQLDKLRKIGFEMAPLMLTTGYGDALGQWYLTRIEEEQAGLFSDGLPRKQQFTLEFERYGEDYSDL